MRVFALKHLYGLRVALINHNFDCKLKMILWWKDFMVILIKSYIKKKWFAEFGEITIKVKLNFNCQAVEKALMILKTDLII